MIHPNEQQRQRVETLLDREIIPADVVVELMTMLQIEFWPTDPDFGSYGQKDLAWKPESIRKWIDDHAASRDNPKSYVAYRSPATAELQTRKRTLEPRTLDREARTVEAVAASETPAVMRSRNYGYCDEVLLVDGCELPDSVPLLRDHRQTTGDVVGSATDFRVDGTQIVATLRFGRGQAANEVFETVADGHLRAVSIGYSLREYDEIPAGESRIINGRRFKAGDRELRVVSKWKPFELSVVPLGADETALIRASAQGATMSRIATPSFNLRSSDPLNQRLTSHEVAAAMLIRSGCPHPERHLVQFDGPSSQWLPLASNLAQDAVHYAQRLARESPIDLLKRAYLVDQPGADMDDTEGFFRGMNELQSRGNYTTMTNVGRATAEAIAALFLSQYDAGDADFSSNWPTSIELASSRSAPLVTLKAPDPLGKISRGGAADHIQNMEAREEGIRLDRFGGYVQIDEMDLLSDAADQVFGALIPALGAAARAVRPALVLAELVGNPAMGDTENLFSAAHGNDLSLALDATNLATACKTLRLQKDGNIGLNLSPQVLLVPPSLEGAGAKACQDYELLNSTSTQPPRLVVDARLENGVTDPRDGSTVAGSATRWYVAAASHHLVIAYRSGFNRRPQIRSYGLRTGRWGIGVDCQHWLGVAAADWRGIVRSDPS